MRTLIWGKTFIRAFNRTIKKYPMLSKDIEETFLTNKLTIFFMRYHNVIVSRTLPFVFVEKAQESRIIEQYGIEILSDEDAEWIT